MSHYDEANEEMRAKQMDEEIRRMAIGRKIEMFGLFTGHMPAEVQRHWNMLYGVSVARITMLSTIPFILFGVYCARFIRIHPDLPYKPPPFPEWVLPFGFYFFLESIVRLRRWLGGNPMGSFIGWVLFVIWWLFGGKRVMDGLDADALRTAVGPPSLTRAKFTDQQAIPRPERDAEGLPMVDADAERKLQDQYIMRETYIALLSVEDQRKMQQRFGFDPIAQGRLTAAVILFIAMVGGGISIAGLTTGPARFSQLLSALTAILLGAEQIYRFTLLAAGKPAPSMIGPLIRPLLKKVLDAPPVQPVFEGENRNTELPDVWEE
jgi:hypothetical protein